MEAKRADGAVVIPDGMNMTLTGPNVKTTPVFVREDGEPVLQLRELDGVLPHLSLRTVSGAWQGCPLQPMLQWIKENRPALLAPNYKPPVEWVDAARVVIATATEQEWAEAERYYLQVYARWTHQRSGITGVELPPLKKCPPLVQAGWLAVAREKAAGSGVTLDPPSVNLDLTGYNPDELAQLKSLIAKGRGEPSRIASSHDGPADRSGEDLLEFRRDGTVKLPPETHWPTLFDRLEQREDGLVGHHRSGVVIMLRPADGAAGHVLRVPGHLLPAMQQKMHEAQRWGILTVPMRMDVEVHGLDQLQAMAHAAAATAESATEVAVLVITSKMGWLLLGHTVTGKPTDFEALAQQHFLDTGGTPEGWAALSEGERFRRKRWLEDLVTGERRAIGQWIGDALTGRAPPEPVPAAETTPDGQNIRRG